MDGSSIPSSSPTATLYSILGVPLDSTQATITKAYRAKALYLHPDRATTKPSSTDATSATLEGYHNGVSKHDEFAQVTEAYQTLVDPERKSQYDAALAAVATQMHQQTQQEDLPSSSLSRIPRPDSSHVPDFLLRRANSSNKPTRGNTANGSSSAHRSDTPLSSDLGASSKRVPSAQQQSRSGVSSPNGTRPPTVPQNRHNVISTPLEGGGSRRVQTPLSPPGSASFEDLPVNMHRKWHQQFKVGKDGKVERRRNTNQLPSSSSGGVRGGSAAAGMTRNQSGASLRDLASRGSGEGGTSSLGNTQGRVSSATPLGASFFNGFSTCSPVEGFDEADEANAFPAPAFRTRAGDRARHPYATPQRMLPFRPPSQMDIAPDRDEEEGVGEPSMRLSPIAARRKDHRPAYTDDDEAEEGEGMMPPYSGLMVGDKSGGVSNATSQGRSPLRGKLLKRSYLLKTPAVVYPSSRRPSPERATPLPFIGGVSVHSEIRRNLSPVGDVHNDTVVTSTTTSPHHHHRHNHRTIPSAEDGGPIVRRGISSISQTHMGPVRDLSIVASQRRLHQLEVEVANGKSERAEAKKVMALRQLRLREQYIRVREERSREKKEAVRAAREGGGEGGSHSSTVVSDREANSSPIDSGHIMFGLHPDEESRSTNNYSRGNNTMSQVPQTSTLRSSSRNQDRSEYATALVQDADSALAALRDRSSRMQGVAGMNYSNIARDRAQKVASAIQFREAQVLPNTDVPQRRHLHPLQRELRENWARVEARAKTVNAFFGDTTTASFDTR